MRASTEPVQGEDSLSASRLSSPYVRIHKMAEESPLGPLPSGHRSHPQGLHPCDLITSKDPISKYQRVGDWVATFESGGDTDIQRIAHTHLFFPSVGLSVYGKDGPQADGTCAVWFWLL